MKIKMEIQLKITRIKNVHHPRKMARTDKLPHTKSRLKYHIVLWSLMRYSSACHEIDGGVFVISLL